MKLTSEIAIKILEDARGKTKDDKWIEHCICVGNSAGKIAEALNKKGINVDTDKAITLGYLHDIGKYNGESHGHVMRGYEYLKDPYTIVLWTNEIALKDEIQEYLLSNLSTVHMLITKNLYLSLNRHFT